MTSRAFSDHFPSNTNSGDGRQQSTAYQGASHAFSLAAPVEYLPKAYIGTNGALAAATLAGRQGVHLAEGTTSKGQTKEIPPTKTPRRPGTSEKVVTSREQSPSYAAALHAISKSTPATTQKSVNSAPNSRQPSPLPHFMDNKVNGPSTKPHSKDEAFVGATSSLVSLFESKQNPNKNVPITHSVRYVTKPTSAIASPTPIKPPIRPKLSMTRSVNTLPLAVELEKVFTPSGPLKTIKASAAPVAAQSVSRTRASTTGTDKSAHSALLPRTVPEAPIRRRSGARAPLDASLGNGRQLPRVSIESNPLALPAGSPEPSTALQRSDSDPAILPSKIFSTPPSRPPLKIRSSRSFEMKVDSLANTIVAASLASSRAPSPTKPSSPPPRRQKKSLFHNHHDQGQTSCASSPVKAMKHTMREPLTSYEDIEHKKKSILMRKHPHKHHEGNRKRYRAIVTERERRRFDGVWAANKGLYMNTDSSESVLNLVVRDIWSRSGLPKDILADIWELVNINGSDRLDRSEFVVGMWLIDQRLKGRKLPFTVSESLWNSVRLLHGVKVSRHQD